MWKHNPGLRTLDNKDGNWKYMERHWTLPLKEEKENVYIETLEGCVLELNDTDQSVFLRNLTDATGELMKNYNVRNNSYIPTLIVSSFRPKRTLG